MLRVRFRVLDSTKGGQSAVLSSKEIAYFPINKRALAPVHQRRFKLLRRNQALPGHQLRSCGALCKPPWDWPSHRGDRNAPRVHPRGPPLNDSYVRSRSVAQFHSRPRPPLDATKSPPLSSHPRRAVRLSRGLWSPAGLQEAHKSQWKYSLRIYTTFSSPN
jgi:hypothetical protein